MKTKRDISIIHSLLSNLVEYLPKPSITQIAEIHKRSPYKVLLSTIISQRTKDNITMEASNRLFKIACDPEKMIKVSVDKIAEAIYPSAYYNVKSVWIMENSKTILEKFHGRVPDKIEVLLKLNGVGRKTANLVLIEGFGKEAICVDTHVHRISNRLGLVNTKKPDETEKALLDVLPKRYWIRLNEMLVTFGQHICTPISPKCANCGLNKICDKNNLKIRGVVL